MATGTGKTRTVLGMIYRFLDAGRFKRILYLVDRTSLGDQTMDTFKEVKLKELLTLNQMYDVKSLEDKEFEKDTRVHIATVQSLVKRIMYNESDKSLGVSDYDLVIVDEAHRGYILDKEMGDDEVLYRDQNDFRSKYRAVIDYFDAVKLHLQQRQLFIQQRYLESLYIHMIIVQQSSMDFWLTMMHRILSKQSYQKRESALRKVQQYRYMILLQMKLQTVQNWKMT